MKRWMSLLGVLTIVVMVVSAYAPAVHGKGPTTFKMGVANFQVETLDPAFGTSQQRIYWAAIYDTYMIYDWENNLKAGLLTDWKMSDDGMTWTFKLRKGLQFHDGWGEATAEDAKFSLNRFMHPKSESNYCTLWRKKVDSIEVVDKYTFKIHLKSPWLGMLVQLARRGPEMQLLSKAYLTQGGIGVDDFDAQSKLLRKKPVGTAPWEFVEHKSGNYYLFKKREDIKDHFLGMPHFDYLKIILIPELSTRVAMLKTGDLNFTPISGPAVKELQGRKGLGVISNPGTLSSNIFTMADADMKEDYPLKKPKVRRALRLGVDYDLITKLLFAPGEARQAQFPGSRMGVATRDVSMKREFWRSWNEDIARFDLKEARKLLAEAGYPGGKGFRNPDGSRVRLFAALRARSPFIVDLCSAVIGEWRKNLGIDVEMIPMEWGVFKKEWRGAGNHRKGRTRGQMAYYTATIKDTPEASLEFFYGPKISPHMGLNQPELFETIEKISQTINDAKRIKLVEKAWGMVRADERHAHIVENAAIYGTSGIKDCKLVDGWDHVEVTYCECRPIP